MSDFEDDDLANDLDNDFGEVSDVEEDNIEEIKDEIMSPPDDIEPSGDHKELTISEVIEN